MSMSNLPSGDSSAKASDDDRIQVAQLLAEAASNGRLTLEQYEGRLAKAYSATTYDQIERLTSDLPEALEFRRGKSRPAPSTMLLAILSGFDRSGRWNVPGRMTTLTLFGGGTVDLRYADFTSADVEIHAIPSSAGRPSCCHRRSTSRSRAAVSWAPSTRRWRAPGRRGRPRSPSRVSRCWAAWGIKRRKRSTNSD